MFPRPKVTAYRQRSSGLWRWSFNCPEHACGFTAGYNWRFVFTNALQCAERGHWKYEQVMPVLSREATASPQPAPGSFSCGTAALGLLGNPGLRGNAVGSRAVNRQS